MAEARARAAGLAAFRWPQAQDAIAHAAVEPFLADGGVAQPFGLLAPQPVLLDIAAALAAAGVGPVSVARPDYVFEAACAPADALEARVAAAIAEHP